MENPSYPSGFGGPGVAVGHENRGICEIGSILGFWADSTLLWVVLGPLGLVPKVLRHSESGFGVFVT